MLRDRVKAYGKQGTVVFIDADGTEWVNYDNGSKGPLYPGIDTWVVVSSAEDRAPRPKR